MSYLLKTERLRKVYTAFDVATVALDGVDLNIKRGEFVAIMGQSGCGKSSLLNILGLLDLPTAGEMYFMGQAISKLSAAERNTLRKMHIGFVFQSFNLIDELTVYENIELPLIYRKVPIQERRKLVYDIMDEMDISHKRHYFPKQLSGGQQQRVAFSRAVVADPELILADEPTGNLDSAHGQDVMNLLSRLNEKGTTIVIVTHSPAYANYSRRVIHLFDGHIVTDALITI